MGVLDFFKKGPDKDKLAIAEAIALQKTKNRTEIEHEKQLGLKHDVLTDETLDGLFTSFCYDYEKIPVKDNEGNTFDQVMPTGINKSQLTLRTFLSKNNALHFLTPKDAKLFSIRAKAATLILEAEQPVEDATIENSVYLSAAAQLAQINYIDSIEGRKLRALLIDISRTEVGVGEISKQKNRLSV